MSHLLDIFQSISAQEKTTDLPNSTYYDMSAAAGSTFLDIGSGFGKPVFHAAMQTGCTSYGVEIVPARVAYCDDRKWVFKDYYEGKVPADSELTSASGSTVKLTHDKAEEKQLKKVLALAESLEGELEKSESLAKRYQSNVKALQ